MHADTNPALAALPASRRSILQYLKRHGQAHAESIAGELDISTSGARQHLTALEADGLIAHKVERDGPGRPAYVYTLTTASEAFFPTAYGDLTNELLAYIDETEPDRVGALFARRGLRRVDNAQSRLAGLSLRDRVVELARILDDDGYVAGVETVSDDEWLIVEHNCAILAVALRYGNACASELEFIRTVLPDADVRRERHIVEGDHACAYRVRRGQPSPAHADQM